jgi:hypothetical protein
MTENIISEEMAQEQIDLFLEFYEIDLDDLDNEDLKDALSISIKKVFKAIRKGRLEIIEVEDSVHVKQILKKKKPEKLPSNEVIYKELEGVAKVNMKSRDPEDQYGKIYALLGSLSGLGTPIITQFKSTDLSIAECLGALFLAA